MTLSFGTLSLLWGTQERGPHAPMEVTGAQTGGPPAIRQGMSPRIPRPRREGPVTLHRREEAASSRAPEPFFRVVTRRIGPAGTWAHLSLGRGRRAGGLGPATPGTLAALAW